MKMKTKEQYDKRFKRIGAKKQTAAARKYIHGVIARAVRPIDDGLKPRHEDRYCTLGSDRVMPKVPNMLPGTPLIGDHASCKQSLSYWQADEDERGRVTYFKRAMPCVAAHGWTQHRNRGLIEAHGKQGEHIDKLGRQW
jgi:hypothetical protein